EITGANTEPHIRLYLAVEVRSARYAEIEFPGQLDILLRVGWAVIAMIGFNRAQSRLAHIGDHGAEFGWIAIPQPHRMCDRRNTASLTDASDCQPQIRLLPVDVALGGLVQILVKSLLDRRNIAFIEHDAREVRAAG